MHPEEAKAEGELHSPSGRSAPSIGALNGSAGLASEQGTYPLILRSKHVGTPRNISTQSEELPEITA